MRNTVQNLIILALTLEFQEQFIDIAEPPRQSGVQMLYLPFQFQKIFFV